MNFKSKPLQIDVEERTRFHAIFNSWLNHASDQDYEQLELARDQFAPNQVCSAVTLVSGCMARKDLEQQLPASLRQLLKERSWPQADAGAKAL